MVIAAPRDVVDELVDWQMRLGRNDEFNGMCYRPLFSEIDDCSYFSWCLEQGDRYGLNECMVWDHREGGAPISNRDVIDPKSVIWDTR